MTVRVLIAILLFILIFWCYFQIDAALDAVRQHAPEPENPIRIGKVEMRQIDALCRELIPGMQRQPSDFRKSLICHHYKHLVPLLFILASLTGWCASIWLLAIQRQATDTVESWVAFLASFLLAFVVGVVSYLVLISPLSLLKTDTNQLEKAAIFPLLGGLFTRTFFERSRDLLSRIFDLLTGKGKKKR
jgi:hypothetical protein